VARVCCTCAAKLGRDFDCICRAQRRTHQMYRSRTSPHSCVGTTVAIHADPGVPTNWAGNAANAANTVERSLTRNSLTAGSGPHLSGRLREVAGRLSSSAGSHQPRAPGAIKLPGR
jgi:hypothetical protein